MGPGQLERVSGMATATMAASDIPTVIRPLPSIKQCLTEEGLSQVLEGKEAEHLTMEQVRLDLEALFGSSYAASAIVRRLEKRMQGDDFDPFVCDPEDAHCHVIEVLSAKGASSIVYLAGTGAENIFVIKRNTPEKEEWKSRMEREISVHPKLQSIPELQPFVPQMFGHGVHDGLPTMRMERIRGYSLRDILEANKGGLPPKLIYYILSQLSYTLALLHNKAKLMNRDIKLDNILIEEQGRVISIDFGVAKEIVAGSAEIKPTEDRQTQLTLEGHFVGTPGYICHYDPQDSPRSDIYSLGITGYQLLTGNVEPLPLQQRKEGKKEDALMQLLRRMTEQDYSKRPTAAALHKLCRRHLRLEHGQKWKPLTVRPASEKSEDPYLLPYRTAQEFKDALVSQYLPHPAVQFLQRHYRKGIAAAAIATGGLYVSLEKEDQSQPPPPVTAASLQTLEIETPKIVALDAGGQLTVRPAEDGIGGDIILFPNGNRELVLPAEQGVHAYRDGKWCASAFILTPQELQEPFSLTDNDIQQLYKQGKVFVYAYLSTDPSSPRGIASFSTFGTMVRRSTGDLAYFHNHSTPQASDILSTLPNFPHAGTIDALYKDPDAAAFIAAFPHQEELETRCGALFPLNGLPASDYTRRIKAQMQVFDARVQAVPKRDTALRQIERH